jgi:hypothetical protein
MEAIYKEEAEETRRQSQNPPQSQNNAPSQNATQSQNSSQSSAITGSENVSDQTGSNDIIEEIAGITDQTVNQSEINKDKGKQEAGTSKKKPDVKGSSKNDTADDMSGTSSPHVHAQGIWIFFVQKFNFKITISSLLCSSILLGILFP